jgi:CheY-like chemotaxis protein
MRVDSQSGAGTIFTVVLPIGVTMAPEIPDDVDHACERKGRILLVDNDPQVMTILGEMLADAGHHVIPVGSGAEAMRVFVRGGFDLVLTNIGMPGMNGWELAERLRQRDQHVPLIFITGWGLHEQDQARCRGLGISSLLFKPVRPAELHRAVHHALGAANRAGAATA